MKKVISLALILALTLALTACGGKDKNKEAPDLDAFYTDFEASLGEDNTPMVWDLNSEGLAEQYYPGLGDYSLKQSVLRAAAITGVGYEFALVECESEDDVEAVKGILQSRIDAQVNGGAFYPSTVEAWQNADLIVNGNVLALIVAGDQQADAVTAFNDLFK